MVIPILLYNNFLSHFPLPATICYNFLPFCSNFLSHLVIITERTRTKDAGVVDGNQDLVPRSQGPESMNQASRKWRETQYSQNKTNNLELTNSDLWPDICNQGLAAARIIFVILKYSLQTLLQLNKFAGNEMGLILQFHLAVVRISFFLSIFLTLIYWE